MDVGAYKIAISKENYQVTTNDPQGMLLRMNSIFSSISDRLDKLEGFRGELETASGTFTGEVDAPKLSVTDSNDTKIQSME